jgi:hypothetical protein
MRDVCRWLSLLLLPAALAGCGEPPPIREPAPRTEVFRCTERLIGRTTVYCHEDVVGPGVLTVNILPDPRETSWELSIRGLAALAEQCEFHGRFDQTRLSALQGRSEVKLVCPIEADVDREYHEIRFENRIDAPNTSITVSVVLSR